MVADFWSMTATICDFNTDSFDTDTGAFVYSDIARIFTLGISLTNHYWPYVFSAYFQGLWETELSPSDDASNQINVCVFTNHPNVT